MIKSKSWSSALCCMLHFLHINDVSKINVEVISACCGDAQRCKNYTNIDELIAVSCCGHEPINQFTHICCQNTVRQRWHRDVYHERCCGNETISIKQTCCGNVVSRFLFRDCGRLFRTNTIQSIKRTQNRSCGSILPSPIVANFETKQGY